MKTPTRPKVLDSPSLSGPKEVRIGRAVYGVPERAGVVSVAGGALVYVLASARLHLFTEAGEVEIPRALRPALASRYFGAGKRP